MAFRQRAVKALCQVLTQQFTVLVYVGVLRGLSILGLFGDAAAQLLKKVRSGGSWAVSEGANTKTSPITTITPPSVGSGVRELGAHNRSPQLSDRPAGVKKKSLEP